MTIFLGRATSELCVSIAASAIVALMVLAGGLALEATPSDAAETSAGSHADPRSALVICRDDRYGFRCIPEDS